MTYTSDEEPPPEDSTLPSWRLDPETSLSDWTIEIVAMENDDGNESTHVYHVHKQNLAVGPRSSQYFAQLFRNGGRFAESQTSTSRIPLHPLAAEHFEALLDYL